LKISQKVQTFQGLGTLPEKRPEKSPNFPVVRNTTGKVTTKTSEFSVIWSLLVYFVNNFFALTQKRIFYKNNPGPTRTIALSIFKFYNITKINASRAVLP